MMTTLQSSTLASDPALYPIWDPAVPFPAFDEMPDLDIVTHVAVERAQPAGYHYLHESAIAWHNGALYLGWANHRTHEVNVTDELIRGRRSTDGGLTWSAPAIWAAAPLGGGVSYNHPVLASHAGRLWGFFTRWEAERPRTEILTLDEATGQWDLCGAHIPGFLPFRPPMQLRDGNWIIGGELFWYESAVAISHGDDFTTWDVVQLPRPDAIRLVYPETALMDLGDRLVAICRPSGNTTAPTAMSADYGRTWTPLQLSNFPLAESQPYCGVLSTGQHYLITDNLDEGRALITIAVTAPGETHFSRIWKLRHQQFPKRRLFGGYGAGSLIGHPTEWSYPAAIEHDGKLFISYTQGKEDCVLSIVPVSVLAV
jgi:hypothetical protein